MQAVFDRSSEHMARVAAQLDEAGALLDEAQRRLGTAVEGSGGLGQFQTASLGKSQDLVAAAKHLKAVLNMLSADTIHFDATTNEITATSASTASSIDVVR